MGKNDDYPIEDFGQMNETSWNDWGEPLQPLKVYEWNIYDAWACDDLLGDYPDYYCRSISIPGFVKSVNGEGWVYSDPFVDSFQFTTGKGQ